MVGALNLYADALVWDAHGGLFPDKRTDLNGLRSWRDGGVTFVSINVGFDLLPPAQTLGVLHHYRNWIEENAADFVIASSIKDVRSAKAERKLAVAFDIEGANALADDVGMVQTFYELGVRQMLLAYNLNNTAAGGCHDEDSGLTQFGHAIVREMNAQGMIVDCSHLGFRTTMDIMHASNAPVVFSHSNPNQVWKHPRNIGDEQIKMCAATGGVVGINGMGIFLGRNDISIDLILDHFCYVSDLVGMEHLGIGFDYAPGHVDVGEILRANPTYWPPGNQYDTPDIQIAGPGHYFPLTKGLLARGFSPHEVSNILSGNFSRVASSVWK